MNDEDERVVEEIVTKFLLNTCRLRPQLSRPDVQAALHIAEATVFTAYYENENDRIRRIPLTTGSVAEFYIEPMLPHVGDIDLMYYFSTELAIPRGHPPPTQLPDEFHNYVKVFEIIDSHLPGYVYIELRYLLTECVDDDKYNAVEYDRHQYYVSSLQCALRESDIHGPALVIRHREKELDETLLSVVVFAPLIVYHGHHKPLIGQHDTETTAGQTQQPLIVLSATDVMWLSLIHI